MLIKKVKQPAQHSKTPTEKNCRNGPFGHLEIDWPAGQKAQNKVKQHHRQQIATWQAEGTRET